MKRRNIEQRPGSDTGGGESVETRARSTVGQLPPLSAGGPFNQDREDGATSSTATVSPVPRRRGQRAVEGASSGVGERREKGSGAIPRRTVVQQSTGTEEVYEDGPREGAPEDVGIAGLDLGVASRSPVSSSVSATYIYPWVASMCVRCRGCYITTASGMEVHHKEEHAGLELKWKCGKCGCSFVKLHSVRCHIPKCRGEERPSPVGGRFPCGACGATYGSQRALSTHKRHKHPDVRNEERLQQLEEDHHLEKDTSEVTSLWSAEEVVILKEKEKEFTGHRFINVQIGRFLPRKTCKQISTKRALLNAARAKATSASEEPSVSVSQAEAAHVVASQDLEPMHEGVEPVGTIPEDPENEEVQGEGPTNSLSAAAVLDDQGPFTALGSVDTVAPHVVIGDPLGEPTVDFITVDSTSGLDTVHVVNSGEGELSPPVISEGRPFTPPPIPMEESGDMNEEEWRAAALKAAVRIKFDCNNKISDFGYEVDHALADVFEGIERGQGIGDLSLLEKKINLLCTRMVKLLKEQRGDGVSKTPVVRPERSRPVRNNRSRRKRIAFAGCQELFRKCPAKLAQMVVDDTLSSYTGRSEDDKMRPPAALFRSYYKDLWSVPGRCSVEFETAEEINIGRHFDIYQSQEVKNRIRRLKSNGAAGPDGLVKSDLQRAGVSTLLVKYFALLLVTGVYPEEFRRNRTTLIPKPGKDLANVENWRPITISSVLARVYSGLLEGRLRKVVKLSERQKGFMPVNGCFQNCFIFDEIIRLGKLRDGLAGAQLDISKAFDTLPHGAIEGALSRQGIPRHITAVIMNMYRSLTTALGVKGSPVVHLARGVKQGDPLSPLLFNIVLDKMACSVSELNAGYQIGDQSVGLLAFADDIILLSNNKEGAQSQLSLVIDFLDQLGMRLSPSKSLSFQIRTIRKSWVAVDPGLKINNDVLPWAKCGTPFKYLGVNFTLHKGYDNIESHNRVIAAAKRAVTLPLKPRQKIQLLSDYVIPKFCHRLSIDLPSNNELRRIDSEIRQVLKTILHLHHSTTSAVLYVRKKDGGLGFPKLQDQMRLSNLRAGLGLKTSLDPLIVGLYETNGVENRLKEIASQLNIEYPPTIRELQFASIRLKGVERDRWSRLESQGVGVDDFRNDAIGNSWLADPQLLAPSRFINMLKLRTNTLGTRVVLRRADMEVDPLCRRCKTKPETLGHILGECFENKDKRIHRHNEIVKLIETECLEKGYVVAKEQSFRCEGTGGLLKPDLVIKNEGRVFVADVTVRFENGDYLRNAFTEKVQKYKPLLPQLLREANAMEGVVAPIVIGSRGAVPLKTVEMLKHLGIYNKKIALTMSLVAIRSSIEMACSHLDYS
uniref:Reverse transcriptase domain-containing protein n=1 Tax=Clastoptera arizonana TaxID=38151 RepID=A0A1B6DXY6_9HEMI